MTKLEEEIAKAIGSGTYSEITERNAKAAAQVAKKYIEDAFNHSRIRTNRDTEYFYELEEWLRGHGVTKDMEQQNEVK